MEWPELRGDGTRNGEYAGIFHGRHGDIEFDGRCGGGSDCFMARIGEFGVLGMGSWDYMGRQTVDGDGTRHKHGGVFYQRQELARMWRECF